MNKDRIILTDIYRGPKKFSPVAFRKNSINLRHHTDIFYYVTKYHWLNLKSFVI